MIAASQRISSRKVLLVPNATSESLLSVGILSSPCHPAAHSFSDVGWFGAQPAKLFGDFHSSRPSPSAECARIWSSCVRPTVLQQSVRSAVTTTTSQRTMNLLLLFIRHAMSCSSIHVFFPLGADHRPSWKGRSSLLIQRSGSTRLLCTLKVQISYCGYGGDRPKQETKDESNRP